MRDPSRRNRHCGQENGASMIRAPPPPFDFPNWRNSMPSLTTIYRAGVMLAVGAIAYKGWQLYGPPAEKVKSIAASAVDMAQNAWKNFRAPDNSTHSSA